MRKLYLLISLALLASCIPAAPPALTLGQNIATPDDPAEILQITADDWVRGKADAPVTLIEYSDFQCPACGSYFPILKQLEAEFPDTLRIVVRDFPLFQIHDNAIFAALAAEAAGKQGKYWEMHDALFTHQREWAHMADPRKEFGIYAGDLALNVEQFALDMNSDDVIAQVSYDHATGEKLELKGTPSFFLNGAALQSPQGFDGFRQVISETLQKSQQ